MSIDETKPPKGWRPATPEQLSDEDEPHVERLMRCQPLAEAHRIAREEAEPYVAEALERVAKWVCHEGTGTEEWRNETRRHISFDDWCAEQLLRMARGERPLP